MIVGLNTPKLHLAYETRHSEALQINFDHLKIF